MFAWFEDRMLTVFTTASELPGNRPLRRYALIYDLFAYCSPLTPVNRRRSALVGRSLVAGRRAGSQHWHPIPWRVTGDQLEATSGVPEGQAL